MLFHRGKIRNVNSIFQILKNSIDINQNRFNSDSAYNKGIDFTKLQTEYSSDVIEFLKTPQRVLSELEEFVRPEHYQAFSKFPNRALPVRKIQPTSIPYTSIKSLSNIISDKKMKRAFELVLNNYNDGKFLTDLEFLSLFVQFSPFNWYAHKLLQLYQERINFKSCKKKVLMLMLKVCASNLDYKLFDEIFQLCLQKGYIIPDEILISAIQVYMKTENVQLATQLFNQHVLSSLIIPPRVLDVYISNLYNQTKNVSMCMDAYRLWLSKSSETNIAIDSFMYNLIVEHERAEDIAWMESSLRMRNRLDRFPIKFGSLCNELSKKITAYEKFIHSESMHVLEGVAKFEGNEALLIDNLTYLHLRHRKYKDAITSFQRIEDESKFRSIVYSVLRHFEKEEKPDKIFQVLINLKNEAKLDIHWQYILIYWRCALKRYPYLASKIHMNFIKQLKQLKYHRYSFLSKLLRTNPYPNNNQSFDTRDFPVLNFGKLDYGLDTLPAAPKLKNIESRMIQGILPNRELIRKSIKFTEDRKEFDRLLEISNLMDPKASNIRLNVDIFYKESFFGNVQSVLEFVIKEKRKIRKNGIVSDKDLCELFKMCYKCDLYEEAGEILSMFKEFNVVIVGDQQMMKFISVYVKWCWRNKKFQDLVLIMEWIKVQNQFVVDSFFLTNLKTAAVKFVGEIDKEISLITLDVDKLEELEHIRDKVIPSIIGYYDSVLEELKEKHNVVHHNVINETRIAFAELMKWVDEDTELMFEGEW
ncbi:hypothetical protein CANINC_000767 [Pichia inconspicua]|uniref:Mitochondrial group I intron splicing factor CCM1 n=1 Tax=Pichia inconspicua TaxID=52247 RepID=A0A4T0X6I1_9ASCO|nr:hypothetical protein CANINC_000767 [[Candida] inconspicua]